MDNCCHIPVLLAVWRSVHLKEIHVTKHFSCSCAQSKLCPARSRAPSKQVVSACKELPDSKLVPEIAVVGQDFIEDSRTEKVTTYPAIPNVFVPQNWCC